MNSGAIKTCLGAINSNSKAVETGLETENFYLESVKMDLWEGDSFFGAVAERFAPVKIVHAVGAKLSFSIIYPARKTVVELDFKNNFIVYYRSRMNSIENITHISMHLSDSASMLSALDSSRKTSPPRPRTPRIETLSMD